MSIDIDQLTGGWDYGSLPTTIRIGEDVWFEDPRAFERYRSERNPGLVIGDRVRIYTWTRFSLEPPGFVSVGDDAVLVGAMFMSAGEIRIGARTVVSYGVTIADSDFHPHDPVARRRDAIAHAPAGDQRDREPFEPRPVVIGDDVRIGVGAIVLKGVRIGDGAVVEPGAVVTRSVPAGGRATGNPAVITGR